MAKEGLGDKTRSYRCCSACVVVMMIFWTMLGFVAGLLVVTLVSRGQLLRELGVMGSADGVDRVTDVESKISKPPCLKSNSSHSGPSGTLGHCSVCMGTR